jgi:hypothetical protein
MTATSSSPDRAELAKKQASLVRALVGQAPVPAGFDAARIQLYGQSLVEKRIGGVALVWTRLAAALGKNYAPLFREYAKRFPHPRWGHGLVDGLVFARWLDRAGLLPDDGQLEKLGIEIRSRLDARGQLVPRWGFAFRALILHNPRRLVLAIRVPGIGEKWLAFARPGA